MVGSRACEPSPSQDSLHACYKFSGHNVDVVLGMTYAAPCSVPSISMSLVQRLVQARQAAGVSAAALKNSLKKMATLTFALELQSFAQAMHWRLRP